MLRAMIIKFNHKGLKRFFETGSKSGIQSKHEEQLRLILALLNAATKPEDMELPGLKLHKLIGDRKSTWSVRVSGNWRITFIFNDKNADDVNYEDYH